MNGLTATEGPTIRHARFSVFAGGRILAGALLSVLSVATAAAQRIDFSWPTPNPAWEQGKNFESWVQPTVSGEPTSGLFGSVRSGGTQFHEGLDIRPTTRDRRGAPTDKVTAAMDGVVRNISTRAGDSSYGRYIVMEHPGLSPAVYTLYAHLSAVEPGIAEGTAVKRGQVIATMGNTAGGYAIPLDRAHLHFEIGLMMSRQFQAWYDWKKFGSPNKQGMWNGMNLMGIDPRVFLEKYRARQVNTVDDYLHQLTPAVRFRIATTRVPDFITRYPSLLQKPMNGLVGGWEVECDVTGLPYAWTPLDLNGVLGMKHNAVEILSVDRTALHGFRGKTLTRTVGGKTVPGSDLLTMLQLVFGVR